jgi:hypothetical protein
MFKEELKNCIRKETTILAEFEIKTYFCLWIHVPPLEPPHVSRRGLTRSLGTTVLSTTEQFRGIPCNHYGIENHVIMGIFNFISLHQEIGIATMTVC